MPNINSDIAIRKNTFLDSNESRVLEFARSNGAVTRADVEKMLGISASTASRLLKCMAEERGLLQRGRTRSTRYVLVD